MARLQFSHRKRGIKEGCDCAYCRRKDRLTWDMFWCRYTERTNIYLRGKRDLVLLEKY